MTKSEALVLFSPLSLLRQNFCGLHQDFLLREKEPRVICSGFGLGLVGARSIKSLQA